ncbi:MAG: hypothetical protein ACHQUC_09130 [Chlamydiales bacterium]
MYKFWRAVQQRAFVSEVEQLQETVAKDVLTKAIDCTKNNLEDWQLERLPWKLSNQAFEDFKNKILEKFPSKEYADIAALYLSRTKISEYFQMTLKELIKSAINTHLKTKL